MNKETFQREYIGIPFQSVTLEDIEKSLKQDDFFTDVQCNVLTDHRDSFDGWRIVVRHEGKASAFIELNKSDIDHINELNDEHESFDAGNHIKMELIRQLNEVIESKKTIPNVY